MDVAVAGVEWDEELASKVVARVAGRKLHLFAAYPEISKDDLRSEGLMAARALWPKYDPSKGAASAWIYRAAAFRIIDLHRRRCSLARREGMAAANKPVVAMPSPDDGVLGPDDLADWCAMNYHNARLKFGPRQRRMGWMHYDLAQVAAVVLLQERMELDVVGVTMLLATRKDVLRALKFFHVPGRRFFEGVDGLMRRGIRSVTESPSPTSDPARPLLSAVPPLSR